MQNKSRPSQSVSEASSVRVLMLGDVVGKIGRDAAEDLLPALREQHRPHFVIVNGENSAGGLGITPEIADTFLELGVDVITLGNHTWSKRDIFDYLNHEPRLLRPANYPEGSPGRGHGIFTAKSGFKIGVANLMGRTFMEPLLDPFRMADTIIASFRAVTNLSFFDFHAEATSEKTAFGHYLDGRASVVVGTHTHVQTADERILIGGTGYLTDVGMCGPQESVLGMDSAVAVQRFVTQMPHRFQVATGPAIVCGIIADIDQATGKTVSIERIQIRDVHS